MDTNLARIISSKQELVEARHRKKIGVCLGFVERYILNMLVFRFEHIRYTYI